MFNSIGDLTNKIIDIETTNKLFDWTLNEVFIWEIVRYQVYTSAVNINFEKGFKIKQTIGNKLITNYKKIVYKMQKDWNAITYHPFFDAKQREVLVFESSRKLLFNGIYVDPYTEFTCRDFKAAGINFTKYQSSFAYDRLAKRDADTKSIDLAYLLNGVKAKFKELKIKAQDLEKIEKIGVILNKELNIDINFLVLVKKEIKSFKLNYIFFQSLLQTKKPKEIYLVNFCDKPALISAAKKLKIRVTDIQHGLISSDDIIYNYPGVKEGSLQYFPDRFYAWSAIWSKLSKLPLSEENIIEYGNKYLTNQKAKYQHVSKNPNQVIIVSQPGFTNAIVTEVLKNIKTLSGFKMLYKLHPAEYDYAFHYPEFDKLKQQQNFTFVPREADLYELLAESPYVLGLGSTVLIEAKSFDCKVLLFNLPGVEWMAPFIDNVQVKMFEPQSDLKVRF